MSLQYELIKITHSSSKNFYPTTLEATDTYSLLSHNIERLGIMTAVSPLLFQGTLLNTQGSAIPNAKVQLWQADFNGNYLHPDSGDDSHLLSDFQYFGTDATDSDGRFDFLTYRPGAYANRPRHFHFVVWVNDAESGEDSEALVTQFYFREDPLAATVPEALQLDLVEVDSDLYMYRRYVNGMMVIDVRSTLEQSPNGNELELTPEQSLGPFYPVVDFFSMDNDLTLVDDASAETAVPTVSPLESATSSSTCQVSDKTKCGCDNVNKSDYRGTINTTKNGSECARLDDD